MAGIQCGTSAPEMLPFGDNQSVINSAWQNGGQAFVLGQPVIMQENNQTENKSETKLMTLPIDNLFILNAHKHYQEYDYVFPLPACNTTIKPHLPILNFKNPLSGYLTEGHHNESGNSSQSTPSEGISHNTPLCGGELFINKNPRVSYYKNHSSQTRATEIIRKTEDDITPAAKPKSKTKKVSYKTTPIENCPHTERKHYAKKMCYICYIKHGRTKKAWKCKHPDRVLYAKGMCKSCYLKFNIESRKKAQQEEQYQIESPVETRVNKLVHKF